MNVDNLAPPPTIALTRQPHLAHLPKLFTNHMDAWGVALVIVAVALIVHCPINGPTTLLMLAIGLGYWLAFALNDYCDAPFDALDPTKAQGNFFVLVTLTVGQRRLAGLGLIAIVGGLTAVFAQFGPVGLALLAVCLLIPWAYSAPPLRLKARPGLDLLTHAAFVQTFPYLLTLRLIEAPWSRLDGFITAVLFLASLTAQMEQQVRDYAIDSQTERNFTTIRGLVTTERLLKLSTSAIFAVCLLGLGLHVFPPFIITFGAIGLPALLHRFLRQQHIPRSEWLVTLSVWVGIVYTAVFYLYYWSGELC